MRLSRNVVAGVAVTLACNLALALGEPPSSAGQPLTPRQAAPIDLTGYWVSVVTEDWRWRMLTPPRGDTASVPLNAAGKKLADAWSDAEKGSCKAYGAGGVMRMPTRLHITWADASTLVVQTDWGEQTRDFRFSDGKVAHDRSSLQGESVAAWEYPVQIDRTGFGPERGPRPPGGDLKVVTTDLLAGWLRRNGVPYSDRTVMTEYYQTFDDPLGRRWFDVTTEVVDPVYLMAPFTTSSDFRKEPNGSRWSPHPCK